MRRVPKALIGENQNRVRVPRRLDLGERLLVEGLGKIDAPDLRAERRIETSNIHVPSSRLPRVRPIIPNIPTGDCRGISAALVARRASTVARLQ